jgi:hypothetical protein
MLSMLEPRRRSPQLLVQESELSCSGHILLSWHDYIHSLIEGGFVIAVNLFLLIICYIVYVFREGFWSVFETDGSGFHLRKDLSPPCLWSEYCKMCRGLLCL